MDNAVAIIKALLELIAQGNFSVNTNGAKQIAGLIIAAEAFITEQEATVEEIESDA